MILYTVFFYVRYAVSYRDLEEIMAERGVQVDHATLNLWVVKYSPDIAKPAQMRKQPTAGSWRMDETYIKAKGTWTYLYRTVDFMLSHLSKPKAVSSSSGLNAFDTSFVGRTLHHFGGV